MTPEQRALVDGARRRAGKATPGPVRVNRYDNEGGLISYQLQQASPDTDATVLCAFDDEENPRASLDAAFYASARSDVPALCDLADEQAARIASLEASVALLDEQGRKMKQERDEARAGEEAATKSAAMLRAEVERMRPVVTEAEWQYDHGQPLSDHLKGQIRRYRATN